MRQSDKPCVSIIRCKPYDSLEAVFEPVRQAIDLVGGMESLVMAGDTVLIKPNLVSPLPYTTGVTTNPYVVEALIVLAKKAGAKRIIVGDGSCVGVNTKDAFKATGLDKVVEPYGVELVDLATSECIPVINPQAKKMKRIMIPRAFAEANVVIDVPVMKTHDAMEVTLGVKNMKGIIRVNDKKRFHKWGLVDAIVDLIHIAKPDLTVTDGTVALEGCGPASGDPVGLGLVLASKDVVAVDAVAMDIMGYTMDEVDYIRIAGEEGVGCHKLEEIEILGEELCDVRRPFARSRLNEETLKEYNIRVLPCDACSGCANAVTNYLLAMERRGKMEQLRNTILLYGQSVDRLPEEETEGMRVIRIGSCTRGLLGYGDYFPGCPPFLYTMLDELEQGKE